MPCRDTTAPEFEEIWRLFRPRLLRFLRARLADDASADDVLQEVLIRVHANLGCLTERGSLTSWLFRITRNALIDHQRRYRPVVELTDLTATDAETPDRDAQAELAAAMRELLQQLSAADREALTLTEFDGLSQVELARRLKLSPSGAKSRVQRARARLCDLLCHCCHLEFDARGRVADYWAHCCCCDASTGER